MNAEKAWAIIGECGLYYGTAPTMHGAIAQHVHDLYGASQFIFGGQLDEKQKKCWHACRKRGDRVVKVEVRIIEREEK